MFSKIAFTLLVIGLVGCYGCKRDSESQKKQADSPSASTVVDDHGHDHPDGESHTGADDHTSGGGARP